jgi:hypothetical protein
MAILYRCDRCNAESDEQLPKLTLPASEGIGLAFQILPKTFDIDICWSCVTDLKKWLTAEDRPFTHHE